MEMFVLHLESDSGNKIWRKQGRFILSASGSYNAGRCYTDCFRREPLAIESSYESLSNVPTVAEVALD